MNPSFLLLAAFVSPGLATAGVLAMAAPILIHLLARRRFKRVRWAAMEFLIDAERRNRRRIYLEEWVLLALRCLAVLMLGLLVARPFLRPSGVASMLGGARRTERVFVIDDSYSMGYPDQGGGEGTLFDRSKTAVRTLLDVIRAETPDDTVTLIRSSAPDQAVVSGAFLDQQQHEQILAHLEAMEVSQQTIEMSSVFEGVVESLNRDESTMNAVVYFVSDFQRVDWVRRGTESGSAEAPLCQPLLDWMSSDRGLRAVLVNLGDRTAVNTTISDLGVSGAPVVAGTTAMVNVEVAHFSGQTSPPLAVSVRVGRQQPVSKDIGTLSPRQDARIALETDFVRSGDEGVVVSLPSDPLEVDNTRYMAVPVETALRVLVVNGEPSADSFDDEVSLLATALRPEGEVFSGMEVSIVDEASLNERNFADVHAIILANVYRVSEPVMEGLRQYVGRGGGLMIFLGDQVDAPLFNASFFDGGKGLAPIELSEVVRPPEAVHFVVLDPLHPAMRTLGAEADPLGISQVPFLAFFAGRVEESAAPAPAIDAEPGLAEATPDGSSASTGKRISSLEGGPASSDFGGRRLRILARFDDAEAHPALMENEFGRGRVLVLTSSVDKEWNYWPDHPSYVPMMLELVRHVARQESRAMSYLVGQPIEMRVDPNAFIHEVTVRTPHYPNEPEGYISAGTSEDGQGLVARWEHTDQGGIYQFVLRRHDGGEFVQLAAVNVDPREGDLTMASEVELGRAFSGIAYQIVEGLEHLSADPDEARREFWTLCLVLAAGFLMLEQTLAWAWGRRR